jgi:hypothetical protein
VWSSRTTTKKLVCFRSTASDTQKPNTIKSEETNTRREEKLRRNQKTPKNKGKNRIQQNARVGLF